MSKTKENRTPGKRFHNPKTKYSNSKRKPVLWAIRQEIKKDKKTNEEYTVDKNIYVPHDTLWDPELLEEKRLYEPFDALKLDWMEELVHWAIDNGFKVERSQLEDGSNKYVATNGRGDVMLTVYSNRQVLEENRPKKKRRKRKSKEE